MLTCGVEHRQLRVPYAPAAGPSMRLVESEGVRPRIPLPVGLIADPSDPEGFDIRKAVLGNFVSQVCFKQTLFVFCISFAEACGDDESAPKTAQRHANILARGIP